jgi:hypothetical protein
MVKDKLQIVQFRVATKRAGPHHIWRLEVGTGKMYRYFDTGLSPVSFDMLTKGSDN